MSVTLEIVIFSFNRGRLLLNCIESLSKYMPGFPVTVFDDRSSDTQTLALVERIDREGSAVILTAPEPTAARDCIGPWSGSLYENMQSFLDLHARRSLTLFLQDDSQIVRSFEPLDKESITNIFSDHPRAAFAYPAFLTYRNLLKHGDPVSLAAGGDSFSFRLDYKFSGYFDVCIAHIDRLRGAEWQFGNELETSISARARFGPMRLMRRPFVAHLPSPPTYRARRQTLALRFWEKFRAGLYPIDPMSGPDLQRLALMAGTLPTAENFLTSKSFWGEHPWPYSSLEGAPRLVLAFDKIETGLRRRLNRDG